MTFKADVDSTHGLTGAHKPGLKALSAPDLTHITLRATTHLSGSVNVDAVLAPIHPHSNRWDYVIAQKRPGKGKDLLRWVEVHPASGSSNVGEVAKKGGWLLGWLKTTPLAAYERRLIWVASGRCAYTARDPKLKALASMGIQFAGGHLEI